MSRKGKYGHGDRHARVESQRASQAAWPVEEKLLEYLLDAPLRPFDAREATAPRAIGAGAGALAAA